MAPALGYIGLAIGLVVLVVLVRILAKAGAPRAVPVEVESAPAESTGPQLPLSAGVPSSVTIESMKQPERPPPNSAGSPIAKGPSGLPNVGAFLEEAAASKPSGAIQESTQVMSVPPRHEPKTPVVLPKTTLASNEMAAAAAEAIAVAGPTPVVNLSKATLASNEMAAAQAVVLERNPVKATLPSQQPGMNPSTAKSTLPSGFRPPAQVLEGTKKTPESGASLDGTRMLAAAALGLLEAGDIEGAKKLLRRALSDG